VTSLVPAIVAATRDAAKIARVNSGMVAADRSADFIILSRWLLML
jgi:imidazolonepropionase-like amidohydrolase